MYLPTLTRRAAMIGALASSAALIAPIAAAAKPVFVRVGSPTFAVSPEIMAAIHDWKRAVAVKAAALDAYCGPNAPKFSLPVDHPLRSAWIDADDGATHAQHKLLRLLSELAA